MMKILSQVNCHDPAANPGDILDLDDEVARRWIADGWGLRYVEDERAPAPIVDPESVVETAAFEGAPERAVGRRQRVK